MKHNNSGSECVVSNYMCQRPIGICVRCAGKFNEKTTMIVGLTTAALVTGVAVAGLVHAADNARSACVSAIANTNKSRSG